MRDRSSIELLGGLARVEPDLRIAGFASRCRVTALLCGLVLAAGPVSAASFPEEVALADLDPADGVRLTADGVGDRLGASVASVGDVNDDGIDDLLFGSPGATTAGLAYVVFGGDVLPTSLDELDGTNGFVLSGGDDGFGESVAGAGDLNDDGIADLVVGAPAAAAGTAYVVFGSAAAFPADLDVSSLDGSDGFAVVGVAAGDAAGTAVAAAGDVNDDGIGDLVVGAPLATAPGTVASEAGAAYVVFGSASAFAAAVELADLDGSDGFALLGVDALDHTGHAVSAAGDVDGDGIEDLIVAAPDGDPVSRDGAGEVYVLFGSDDDFDATIDASALDGTIGFVLRGAAAGDGAGGAVASAGDFNGDGFGDVAIGAPNAAAGSVAGAGATYLVFGTEEGFADRVELGELEGGRDGVVLPGVAAGERSGGALAAAGDVDGDGLGDLLIGAAAGAAGAGATYLVLGTADLLEPAFELSTLDGRWGAVFEGAAADDASGSSVASAGDLDGDGLDELLIGAPATPSGAGSAYVVFGQPACRVPVACGVERLAAQTLVGPLWTSEPGGAELGGRLEDEYLVGDWDGNGCSDLAVRRGNLVLMSTDNVGGHDLEIRYGRGNDEEEYLVGDWNQDGCDDLAVRRHNLLYMDSDFDGFHDLLPRFGLGAGEDEYLVGDYNGDRADDLVVRRNTRLFRDLFPWDAVTDNETKYGFGNGEDQYLVGHWSFPPGSQQTFAVRRGNDVLMNFEFDPMHDLIQRFGLGAAEDEYLVGDWDGDGRDNLGVRRGNRVLVDFDFDGQHDAILKFGTGTN